MCTAFRITMAGFSRGMEISFAECASMILNVNTGSLSDDKLNPEDSERKSKSSETLAFLVTTKITQQDRIKRK